MDKIARRNLVLASAIAAPAIVGLRNAAKADTIFTGYAYPLSIGTAFSGATAARTTSARFLEPLNVKDFGAVGNNIADDTAAVQACLDAAFGPASSPHGISAINYPVYFPAGTYNIATSPGLSITGVNQGHIFGSGRNSSQINLTTGGSTDACLRTNGCQYVLFENMTFNIASNATVGTCFDLDVQSSMISTANIQSNVFSNCNFNSGAFGIRINNTNTGGSQGSENCVFNCYFQGPPVTNSFAGLYVKGQNALMNIVIGGNFAHCGNHAINIPGGGGSVPLIHGVSFQNQDSATAYDVHCLISNPDDYSIIGCRSESNNFALFSGGSGVTISGCVQTGGSGGVFLQADGGAFVSGCHINGQFLSNGNMTFENCLFGAATPWTGSAGTFNGLINQWHGPPPGTTIPQGRWTFSTLPPASMCTGMRLYIIDASVAASTSTNFGTTLAASGTAASFTGSLNDGTTNPGTFLTVSSGTGIAIGQTLRFTGAPPGLLITSGSGTSWGTNFAAFASAGTSMTTGATNYVPIWSDGTTWRIG